jgi:hypothetical protein
VGNQEYLQCRFTEITNKINSRIQVLEVRWEKDGILPVDNYNFFFKEKGVITLYKRGTMIALL